ncbi:hypothetical protein CEXT_573581 [Caerostris extrusa]|uniref:Uncharacterized protein n=1 Tax=Caerostris extrusa TaxID=172846 RepID=A0AAV4SAS1_CAEEX|nr:hypothetical protein CEXT_573581 [Caerostris extrusa]
MQSGSQQTQIIQHSQQNQLLYHTLRRIEVYKYSNNTQKRIKIRVHKTAKLPNSNNFPNPCLIRRHNPIMRVLPPLPLKTTPCPAHDPPNKAHPPK